MSITVMAGDTESATSLDVLIPEIWGPKINDYFRADLIAGNFFMDRSSELRAGGDILHTPNLSAMTANTKANDAGVTLDLFGAFVNSLYGKKLLFV